MKIALVGYGKMGKVIEKIACERNHQVILKIDLDNQDDLNSEKLSQADAVIEFTGPQSAYKNVKSCLEFGIPVVCGSTGWIEHLPDIEDLCIRMGGAFLYASNFSVGVNIFFALNKKLAQLMSGHPEYEVSMTEIHHTQKRDSPSGTAITLADQVLAEIKRKHRWVNHLSDDPGDLEIISERVDPAPGTHQVRYTSSIDDIEIMHTAHNREGFALGAVLAAEFLQGRKGIFSMKDVLNLE